MVTTFQFESQDMLQHGFSVLDAFNKLKNLIENNDSSFEEITGLDLCQGNSLLQAISDSKAYNTYLIYHDCGKPDSLVVDEEGRSHYPDHANVSADKFAKHGKGVIPEDSLNLIVRLIRKDMCFHSLKGDELKEFIKNDSDAPILLLAAWASLISNSDMFGGMETDSFKIKAKKLRKSGKWLFKEEG